MARRIRKAEVKFLSLCPKGANNMRALYKDDGSFTFGALVKDDGLEERGELVSVVYAPDYFDTHEDCADADTIRDMAHNFSKNGMQMDLRHNEKPLTKEQAYIAESFIIQKGDPRFAEQKDADGNPVDVTGGWAIIAKIDDPELRRLYREGEWGGVSVGGVAAFEPISKEDEVPSLLRRIFNSLRGSVYISGDIDMTKDDMAALLKESNSDLAKTIGESLTASLTKALEPLTKATETPKGDDKTKDAKPDEPKAPVFDMKKINDPEAIAAFEKEVKVFNLTKSLDTSDPEAVAKVAAQIAEINKEDEGDTERKPSNQPPAKAGSLTKSGEASADDLRKLAKEDAKAINEGKPIAAVA